MKTIEVFGDNYSGEWKKIRYACRAVIVDNGMILLSYAKIEDLYMIPGGGLEDGETYEECCAREVSEETGYLIKPSECVLDIDEYYEDHKYISKYFFGTVVGKTDIKLTPLEKIVELTPKWIPLSDAIDIFSKHADYADNDEMKRGMYLREFTALSELIK